MSSPTKTTVEPNYYAKGSVELAVETPVMMKKLEKVGPSICVCVCVLGFLDGTPISVDILTFSLLFSALQRADLTNTAELLLIVLVGLPARGKSFISRKLLNYLTWRGNKCKIFNVGQYRRQATAALPHEEHDHYVDKDGKRQQAGACDADFFDDSNTRAVQLREKAAHMALHDAFDWISGNQDTTTATDGGGGGGGLRHSMSNHSLGSLDQAPGFADGHTTHSFRRQKQRIAVFDATNSTKERRRWILNECAEFNQATGKQMGVVFVESICDDKDLLAENFHVKIASCPDFEGMTQEEALEDLRARVHKYELRYEPIDDLSLSYIKIFNLSSRLEVNHIYGRLAKVIVPAIMSWNVGSRPIYLCRAGETRPMQLYMEQMAATKQQQKNSAGSAATTSNGLPTSSYNNTIPSTKRMRGDRLGEGGLRFRDALGKFIVKEGKEYMERKNVKNVIHPSKLATGTSITGLYPKNIYQPNSDDDDDKADADAGPTSSSSLPPFPCLVMSSTLPRALETATAWEYPFQVKDISNLNPLDMGDFAGMDLASIRERHPDWYAELKREPFHTRYVKRKALWQLCW
jgi:hypothetical protein